MDTTSSMDDALNSERFLGTSQLCDVEHPIVASTAAMLAAGEQKHSEIAKRIHRFIRDDVKHHWVPMGQKASTTLERRVGDCWPKSIAQVALLRASGIPARFRWIEYHKELFRGLVPHSVYAGLADPFPFHVLAEAYIDGRWIKSDATFDRQLRPDRAVDWDGCSDLVALAANEISADLGFTSSFEERIPQIEQFFGSSGTDSENPVPGEVSVDAPNTMSVDMESEIVNLYFDFLRVRNRFDEVVSLMLRSVQ